MPPIESNEARLPQWGVLPRGLGSTTRAWHIPGLTALKAFTLLSCAGLATSDACTGRAVAVTACIAALHHASLHNQACKPAENTF
jgi:hypothetical protein